MDYVVLIHVMVIVFIYSDTMYIKKCELCGKEFQTSYCQTKYCSDECKKTKQRQQAAQWRRNHNELVNLFTPTFIEELRNNTYDYSHLSPYWRKRENESPGYVLSVAELYNNCQFTCEVTGYNGYTVHHLNGYHWDIEGRNDKNNMIVINTAIHDFFHLIYGNRYNTIEQFDEFLNIHFCTSIDTILNNRGVQFCN